MELACWVLNCHFGPVLLPYVRKSDVEECCFLKKFGFSYRVKNVNNECFVYYAVSIHYLYVSEIQLYFSSSEEINIGIKGQKGRQIDETEEDKGLIEGREMEDWIIVQGCKIEGKMYVYCTSFHQKRLIRGNYWVLTLRL